MGLLETEIIENLLHSSSISKGIERTMERMVNVLEIDRMYIIHFEEGIINPRIIFDWDNIKKYKSIDANRYLEFLNEGDHFDQDEMFVIESTKLLSEEEIEFYHAYGWTSLIEFKMTKHGKNIGFIILEWDELKKLSKEELNEIHILLKLMNEQLIKKFYKEVLGENDGRLFKLANNMTNTLIYLLDEDFKIQFSNEYARKTYPDIKIGDACYKVIKGEDTACKECILNQLKENKFIEKQMYFPYLDDTFHVNATLVDFQDNGRNYLITMQKQSIWETGNRREMVDEKFIFALQTLYKDIIAVEIRRDAFYNLFKEDHTHKYSYSMDFVLKWLSKVHLDDKQKFLECFDINFLQNAYLSGESHKEIDFRYRTHEGTYHCMNAHILFEQSSNKDVTVYIMFQDIEQVRSVQIEEYRNLRDALMAARSAAALKSEVLADISHEIQSPISGIISMTTVAKQVYKEKDKLLKCIENIDDYAEHMTRVMDYLLQTMKVNNDVIEISKQPFLLESFLNRIDIAVRKSIEQKNVNFFIDSKCQYRQICGDEIRLYQAVCILINNTISYTPISGEINLTASQIAVDDKIVYIRFGIEDTGNGFTEKMQESIFGFNRKVDDGYMDEEHFELSLASKLIQLMGGQIGIEVREKGTYLYFTLPFEIQENKAKREKRRISRKVDDFTGKRVLIAEDSEMTQDAFRAILEVVGFNVDIVDNGKKAVVQFVSQPAHTYDAILMDVHMPFMDGHEATKCIRISGKEDAEDIPIIGLMVNTSKEDVKESLEAGMQAHLAKPVDVDKLYQVLRKVISEE